MRDAAEFVTRWHEAWRIMDPDVWAALYDRRATLLQPGMERPIGWNEIPGHVARLHALLPDIRCELKRWAYREDTVFTEWGICATLNGEAIEWEGADRFTVREGLALEEVVYFDTYPLWARLDPTVARAGLLDSVSLPPEVPVLTGAEPEADNGVAAGVDPEAFIAGYTEVWGTPDLGRLGALYHPTWQGRTPTTGGVIGRDDLPGYYARILTILPDFHLDVLRWAAKDAVVFVEFTITATFGDETLEWSGIDRHTIVGDRSADGVSYFDTMPLWERLDPTMKRGFLLTAAVS